MFISEETRVLNLYTHECYNYNVNDRIVIGTDAFAFYCYPVEEMAAARAVFLQAPGATSDKKCSAHNANFDCAENFICLCARARFYLSRFM